MASAKDKKVRAFLKKQHSDIIAVKRKHIAKAVKTVAVHKNATSTKIDDWSNDDGSFDMLSYGDAKKWAAYTALALGVNVRNAISDASQDATKLATGHLEDFSDFAVDTFDADPIDVDYDIDDTDDDRLDDLQAKFVGSSKFGAYATLMKLAAAVALGSMVSDFADDIGADSDDPDDVADSLFSPIESRTETYVRTETGNAYSTALASASSENDLQKRWATIDPGCDEICHPADGQTVDMDDLFEMGDGSAVDYPPAHPNCDCEWLPWHEDWGNLKSTDDIEDQEAA